MKKLSVFIAAIVCSLVFSIGTKAQAPADYFVGKWNITITGLPQGDAKSVVIFERKDGKLTGYSLDEKTGKSLAYSKVEEKGTTVTGYFSASGYDCYLFLEKKDDNNVTGSMMDMFDATGIRVLETKSETK
jgi:hypothetical protein